MEVHEEQPSQRKRQVKERFISRTERSQPMERPVKVQGEEGEQRGKKDA